MKSERGCVRNLAPNRARRFLSLPCGETEPVSSEATVYAGLRSYLPGAVAGVRLIAECMGHEQLIATAGIPAGFDGIAAIVSGVVADAWHVEAYGAGSDLELSAALAIRQCCSGFGVCVPAELQQDVPPLLGEDAPRVLPLGRSDGAWRAITATSPGTAVIAAGDRVTRIVATADALTQAQVTGLGFTWIIPARETRELRPAGNLQGPRSLVFGSVDYYTVEIVR